MQQNYEAPASSESSGTATPLQLLRMLAAGELPLPVAFWRFGIAYGTILNVVFSLSALGVLAVGAPGWAGVLVFLIPVPYNIVVAFGVWRSADAWRGPPVWPFLARLGIVGWAAAASLL